MVRVTLPGSSGLLLFLLRWLLFLRLLFPLPLLHLHPPPRLRLPLPLRAEQLAHGHSLRLVDLVRAADLDVQVLPIVVLLLEGRLAVPLLLQAQLVQVALSERAVLPFAHGALFVEGQQLRVALLERLLDGL